MPPVHSGTGCEANGQLIQSAHACPLQVPDNAAIPQLCSALPANATQGSYSACNYFLHSQDGTCCPSGATNALQPIAQDTCNPTHMVRGRVDLMGIFRVSG